MKDRKSRCHLKKKSFLRPRWKIAENKTLFDMKPKLCCRNLKKELNTLIYSTHLVQFMSNF